MTDDTDALAAYGGTTRLFALPNLVFFPSAVQPLHVFETRYRQMVADALAGDRLISLVLLRPGWECDYEGNPAVHPTACVGRIVADQELPDGRYNLLLRGLARVRVEAEVPAGKLYRVARAPLLTEGNGLSIEELTAHRRALSDLILPRFEGAPLAVQLRELFESELALGQLCDILSFALPLPTEVKQRLLDEAGVGRRAEVLRQQFRPAHAYLAPQPGRRFPPEFSAN